MSTTQTPMAALLSHWAVAALNSDEHQRAFEVAEMRL